MELSKLPPKTEMVKMRKLEKDRISTFGSNLVCKTPSGKEVYLGGLKDGWAL